MRAGQGRPATENHDAEECLGAEKCQQEGARLGSQHQVWPNLYKPVHGGKTEVNPPNVGRGGAGGARPRESIRGGIAGESSPVRSRAGSMSGTRSSRARRTASGDGRVRTWQGYRPARAVLWKTPPERTSGPEDPAVKRRRDTDGAFQFVKRWTETTSSFKKEMGPQKTSSPQWEGAPSASPPVSPISLHAQGVRLLG